MMYAAQALSLVLSKEYEKNVVCFDSTTHFSAKSCLREISLRQSWLVPSLPFIFVVDDMKEEGLVWLDQMNRLRAVLRKGSISEDHESYRIHAKNHLYRLACLLRYARICVVCTLQRLEHAIIQDESSLYPHIRQVEMLNLDVRERIVTVSRLLELYEVILQSDLRK